MDEHIQDKIDNYLLNRMPEEERTVFEKEMETDQELKKRYMFTKVLKQEIEERARLKEKMSKWDEEREKTAVLTRPAHKWMYAAASMAAAVLVGLLYLNIQTTRCPESAHVTQGANNSTFGEENNICRGDVYTFEEVEEFCMEELLSDVEKDLPPMEMVDYYLEKKDYKAALELIEAEIVKIDKNISHNEETEARNALEEDIKNQEEYLLKKAQVLIELDEKEEAATILEELISKGHYMHKSALELLEQIKE